MAESKAKAKSATILLEVDPNSSVDVLGSPDVLIERGERKWFTPAEAAVLLELRQDGRRVLREVPDADAGDS